MDSEMIGILLSGSMHYTIAVSLEMSDEPTKNIRTSESEESHYIDNQTICISIPRWKLMV